MTPETAAGSAPTHTWVPANCFRKMYTRGRLRGERAGPVCSTSVPVGAAPPLQPPAGLGPAPVLRPRALSLLGVEKEPADGGQLCPSGTQPFKSTDKYIHNSSSVKFVGTGTECACAVCSWGLGGGARLLVHPSNVCASQDWPRLKPGAPSGSPRLVEGPRALSRHCCRPGRAAAGSQGWDSNPDPPLWNGKGHGDQAATQQP